jgi:hypothetical protein
MYLNEYFLIMFTYKTNLSLKDLPLEVKLNKNIKSDDFENRKNE